MNDGISSMDSPLSRPALPEKALWYQEVLSLDPNSRIFLPYARLLAELGHAVEAVDVLKAGLLRHPEFLEARLLLIELLHAAGQEAAAGFEADGIIEQLSQSSALWQIWGRRPGLRADQAAMLLFFGASLKENRLSLADVFEAGIAALSSGSARPRPAAPAPGAAAMAGCPAPAAEPLPQQASPATSPAPAAPAQQAVSTAPLFTLDENAPWYALDSVPDDDDIYDDEPEAHASLAEFLERSSELAQGAPAQDVPAPAEDAPASAVPEAPAAPAPEVRPSPAPQTVPRGVQEGKSSLCTRSMAKVLEEQGVTSEAAEIYRELLMSCSTDEERDELNAKLDSLLQGAESSASAASSPASQPSSGVLDMLEELAVRLENRSRA